MTHRLSNIHWKKRKKALEKVTKYSSKLAADFRYKQKKAQSLAYKLELLKEEGKTGQREVSEITAMISTLHSFANIMNSVLVFFMRIKSVNERLESNYRNYKRLEKRIASLEKSLRAKKRVVKKKIRLGKQQKKLKAKAELSVLKAEIDSLKIESAIIKDKLSDSKHEFNDSKKDYATNRSAFKKERKIIRKLIRETRSQIHGFIMQVRYVDKIEWTGLSKSLSGFRKEMFSKETKDTMKELNRWMRKYRWSSYWI